MTPSERATAAVVGPGLLGLASGVFGIVGAANGSKLALAAGLTGLAGGGVGAAMARVLTAPAAGAPRPSAASPAVPATGASPGTTSTALAAASSSSSELPDRQRGPAGGIHDPVTGLFNEHYFAVAVDSRVAAARRHLRPVAIIYLAVSRSGSPNEMADPVAVSNAVRATLRDSDTACRMDDGRFAIILEDTPEEGAILTAERLRRAMGTAAPDHVQRAGIACYPAHAFNANELLAKADKALHSARDWPQHRIEVAAAD